MHEDLDVRPAICYIKQILGSNLTGIEIGVNHALHAKQIYEYLNPKMLFLIDPYDGYLDPDSKEIIGEAQYLKAKENIKNLPNARLIRASSKSASYGFEPYSLDFVYIDGDHSFEGVKMDLEIWYPKLKKGGVLAGHDYHETMSGVVNAVNEFCQKNKINLATLETDWWFRV